MGGINPFAERNGRDLSRIVKRIADRKDTTPNEILHIIYKEIEERCDIRLDQEREKLAAKMMRSGCITTYTLIKTDEDLFTAALEICEEMLGEKQ